MQNTYTLKVAGVTRELPLCPINDKLNIAAFVMLGDIELTLETAKELVKLVPPHDIIITAEAKGIPLTQEMARLLGEKKYLVARKAKKLYMKEPVSVEVQSISTEKKQVLYIDADDILLMKNRRVLIVDDVVSTGESLRAVEELVRASGGQVAGRMAVLAEGEATLRDDIIYLAELPLFPVDEKQSL